MRISIAALLAVFVVAWTEVHAQRPAAPVWVPQAPPFGTIATLSQLPDLHSVWPVAGPAVTDIRVAEWSPPASTQGRFLRLLEVGSSIERMFMLWWFGALGPAEPPPSSTRLCTTPAESPRVCVQPMVAREQQDWKTLSQTLLAARPCPRGRATDGFELRLQVYETGGHPRFREVEICDPVADDLRERFDAMSAHDFGR